MAAKAGHLWVEEGTLAPSFVRREFELDNEVLRCRNMGQVNWLTEFNLTSSEVVLTKNPRKFKYTFRLNLELEYNPNNRKVGLLVAL